ncbi:Arc family DNA-binding protein [Roseofilum reptotaenium CS-1145]|uniref:Plasmid stability protein n=1 Tax=Roseofilum reptotaenium AO1-A TaxID=1925591 RepID=A0A1L9QJH9_9CYAN|nr:Arc family DNA-binding protein [Roseofilum reptotaenium]MDB9520075.1 Arc family DNA-binding protein [Roseofilum reptotaenium CS-1145]OJJ14260.1 plasmid stability protein [Roseofilum reptotaenium AO1-A]
MTSITIDNFDDDLGTLLQERAKLNGRSIEAEAKQILSDALTQPDQPPLNLALAIKQRFSQFDDFELPTIPREPLREPPDFLDLHDCT